MGAGDREGLELRQAPIAKGLADHAEGPGFPPKLWGGAGMRRAWRRRQTLLSWNLPPHVAAPSKDSEPRRGKRGQGHLLSLAGRADHVGPSLTRSRPFLKVIR